VLPAPNRLRSARDFSQITKTGYRAHSPLLALYFLTNVNSPSRVGLIINKSVGGSVTRHRIARQIRHSIRDHLKSLPMNTQMVIRVIKNSEDYRLELEELMTKVIKKLGTNHD
jgi:ribonuclease P protein component